MWTDGKWSFYLVAWHSAYKKVFQPSFADFSATYDWGSKFWARINVVEDPQKPKYKNAAGEEKSNLVPQIVEFFDSEDEAYAAASDSGTVVVLPSQPDKWDEDYGGNWKDYAQSVYDAFDEDSSLDEVAEMFAPPLLIKYGVTAALIGEIHDAYLENFLDL